MGTGIFSSLQKAILVYSFPFLATGTGPFYNLEIHVSINITMMTMTIVNDSIPAVMFAFHFQHVSTSSRIKTTVSFDSNMYKIIFIILVHESESG